LTRAANYGQIKAKVVASHLSNPDWSAVRIAKHLGIKSVQVRNTAYQCQTKLPHAVKSGQIDPVDKIAALRKQVASLNRRIAELESRS
jgi:ubiquinone biosynthesis protein UbiJ